MSSIPHQRCVTCGVNKPLTEFHKHSRTANGYRSACKACRLTDERTRRARWQTERAELPERKRCTKCGEEKLASEFNRNMGTRDGLHSECKECNRIQRLVYRQRDPDRARALGRAADHRRKEKKATLGREWRKRNAIYAQQKGRVYRQQHKEEYRALKRDWSRRHPEYEVWRSHIRRQRVASAATHHTIAEWRILRRGLGDRCLRCGATDDLTIDHVVPLALGGDNHISNLQLLCRSCNSWKNARVMDFRPK